MVELRIVSAVLKIIIVIPVMVLSYIALLYFKRKGILVE